MTGRCEQPGCEGCPAGCAIGAIAAAEALVVGEPDAVDAFTADCRRGPVAARVDRVDKQVHSALPIEGFTILPTETVPHGDREWLRWP